jgi:acyl carrier protein
MDAAQVRDKVRAFVTSNFPVANPQELADETSLLDTGVIDSTGVLEVIKFIEEEFGIKVADDEMVPANLESVANVTAYVGRKRAG